MPFKSEKQRRYMWSQHPEIAKKWEHEAEAKGEESVQSKKRIVKSHKSAQD